MKTQAGIAFSVYMLVATVNKEFKLDRSLAEIMQILNITLFEKDGPFQILTALDHPNGMVESCNQLNLFNL